MNSNVLQFDVATVTWGMKPALVIEMLQISTKNITDSSSFKSRKEKTDDEIIASLKSPKRAFTRYVKYTHKSISLYFDKNFPCSQKVG